MAQPPPQQTPPPKHTDNVNMGFTVDTADKPAGQAPAVTSEGQTQTPEDQIEIKTFNNVKVYSRNKNTGDVVYYDANGNELGLDVITVLQEQYGAPPEYSQTGAEKKGEIATREVKYPVQGKEVFAGEVPVYVVERQDYTDGDSWTRTIPKYQYELVKFLRGENENSDQEKAKEGGASQVQQKV